MIDSAADLLISADSHVIEDPQLWKKRLPAAFQNEAPVFPERNIGGQFQAHSGGFDPSTRVQEMAIDGVSQEILYPSLAMNLFGLADAGLQEACFAVYNDWLVEYCSVAPKRLFGIAAICSFDIDHAVAELRRAKSAGLVGAMVWEVPPPDLSFATKHYEALWEAATDLDMPISFHILTGVSYPWPRGPRRERNQLARMARHANNLVFEASNVIADLITGGALERHPNLKIVLVESEASWIPFYLSRWDNYYGRANTDAEIPNAPSDYFSRQIYATFFNDKVLAPVLTSWGSRNCMWSNDFPHPNSTWPESRQVIERDLGHLTHDDRARLLFENVRELYHLPRLA